MLPPTRQNLVPSANNPRLVARLLEAVAAGVRSSRGLQEALGVELRTVQYYTHAAEWLGLLEAEGEAQLTTLGLEFVYAGRQRPRVWARAIWATPFIADLMQGRTTLPAIDELSAAVSRAEPDLAPATVQRRASAVRALMTPAVQRPEWRQEDHQLALPFVPTDPDVPPPHIELGTSREYDPDAYRHVLSALLDHGELALGQVRAILDKADAAEAPIGGYVDLALSRGDAVRMEERIVLAVDAAERRDLADTTTSIVLSDAGYRAWLAEWRAAARGDREAQIRRDKSRNRHKAWDRRLFGREIDAESVEAELRRVLMDRSLANFPEAKGPGRAPVVVKAPFLDCWEQAGLPIALPPALLHLRGGLQAVSQALQHARRGGQDVSAPDLAHRPVAWHGGLLHPGEPLPRSVPDMRTLRQRIVMHVPYATIAVGLLLLHRAVPGRLEVSQRRGGWAVRWDDAEVGALLEVADGFARHRGWVPSRRRHGGLTGSGFVSALEAVGLATVIGGRLVLAERFFALLRGEAEEMEIHRRLQPLSEALEEWLATAAIEAEA
jgi:hypothetical protein